MMNHARINLLKKNELRHQGAVSHRFLVVAAIAAPILVASIVGGIMILQYSGIQSDLVQSAGIWKDLEPKVEMLKLEKRGLTMNEQALRLFDGWRDSQASFVKLLDDIQATVPQNIQFTRLSVKSENIPTTYESAEKMALTYSLSIEGSAQGEEAENEVIELRRDLLACEQIGATFDSIKLASLRKRTGSTGDSIREFKLVGETEAGDRP